MTQEGTYSSRGAVWTVALLHVNLNRDNGDWCCEWLDDLRHKHRFLHDLHCFYALQETDRWTTSAMNVPQFFVYGRDHGRTAILCPREFNHFRLSWVDQERSSAILVGSSMFLSDYKRLGRLDSKI